MYYHETILQKGTYLSVDSYLSVFTFAPGTLRIRVHYYKTMLQKGFFLSLDTYLLVFIFPPGTPYLHTIPSSTLSYPVIHAPVTVTFSPGFVPLIILSGFPKKHFKNPPSCSTVYMHLMPLSHFITIRFLLAIICSSYVYNHLSFQTTQLSLEAPHLPQQNHHHATTSFISHIFYSIPIKDSSVISFDRLQSSELLFLPLSAAYKHLYSYFISLTFHSEYEYDNLVAIVNMLSSSEARCTFKGMIFVVAGYSAPMLQDGKGRDVHFGR